MLIVLMILYLILEIALKNLINQLETLQVLKSLRQKLNLKKILQNRNPNPNLSQNQNLLGFKTKVWLNRKNHLPIIFTSIMKTIDSYKVFIEFKVKK